MEMRAGGGVWEMVKLHGMITLRVYLGIRFKFTYIIL